MQAQFTFYASILASLFEDPTKINDQLISRIVPYLGISLKYTFLRFFTFCIFRSKILPFKYAGMMIVCQIVTTTSLSVEVLTPILKLILLVSFFVYF